jgi:DinB family protein
LAGSNTDFERHLSRHHEGVSRFLDAASRLDDVAWSARAAADKWCPGQVAEHVALSYAVLLKELRGGGARQSRLPLWRRMLLRFTVMPQILNEGRFPKARAPREIRPPDEPRAQKTVLETLRRDADLFESGLVEARAKGGGHLTHIYFGRLRPDQMLRFMTAHTEHHRRQLPGS